MEITGISFVGTRTPARAAMTRFVREVLGLEPADPGGLDVELFTLADGSSLAVTSPDDPSEVERTVGFAVRDIERATRELRAAGLEVDDEIASSDRQRYVHFRAPDGRLYELVEDIAPPPSSRR